MTGIPCHFFRSSAVDRDDCLRCMRFWACFFIIVLSESVLSQKKEYSDTNPASRREFQKKWFFSKSKGLIGAPNLEFFLSLSESPSPSADSLMLSEPQEHQQGSAYSFPQGGLNSIRLSLGSAKHIFQIQIDEDAPITEVIYINDDKREQENKLYFGRELKIKLNGKEEDKGIQSGVDQTLYSINGAEFEFYTQPLAVFDREGQYSLRYYSVDLVGNTQDTKETEFIVDYLSPHSWHEFAGAHFHYKDQWIINSATKINLLGTDLGSGIKDVFYALDDKPWRKFSRPFALPQSGQYVLSYYAVDQLDKHEVINKAILFVDNIAPDIQFEFSQSPQTSENSHFKTVSPDTFIYIKGIDEQSGIKEVLYRINEGEKKLYRRPIVVSKKNGLLKLTAYVRDWSDNLREKTLRLMVNKAGVH